MGTGVEPEELTLQLCERYGNELQIVLFYRTEQDVETFLAHPLTVVGSDGNAIPLEQPGARPHQGASGRSLAYWNATSVSGVLGLADAVGR